MSYVFDELLKYNAKPLAELLNQFKIQHLKHAKQLEASLEKEEAKEKARDLSALRNAVINYLSNFSVTDEAITAICDQLNKAEFTDNTLDEPQTELWWGLQSLLSNADDPFLQEKYGTPIKKKRQEKLLENKYLREKILPLFNLNDLLNGKMYRSETATLAERIDFAWAVYTQLNHRQGSPFQQQRNKEYKAAAVEFLIDAFNITDTDPEAINKRLIQLMDIRKQHRKKHPEMVPGKAAFVADDSLLSVNEEKRKEDTKYRVSFLNAGQRAEYRLHINKNGLFEQNKQLFDTGEYISHGKRGYASFTLNAYGELSVFNHHSKVHRNEKGQLLTHSSMHAGRDIVAAGELKIENGKLVAVTAYSGHYDPTLFTMKRFLEYVSSQNVDISRTTVYAFQYVSKDANAKRIGWKLENEIPDESSIFAKYEASQLCVALQGTLNTCVDSINDALGEYNDSFLTSFYKGIDFICGDTITQQKSELAHTLQVGMQRIKSRLQFALSPDELDVHIKTMEALVTDVEKKNDELSKPGGRLASQIGIFKEQISSLKQLAGKEDEVIDSEVLKQHR